MAITASPYGLALQTLGEAGFNFTTDTLKVALTTSTYTPNVDTHRYWSSVTNEITGTGYTAGGQTLTSVTWTYDATNNRMQLGCADPLWTAATFTCRYAVFYKSTGTAGTSPLISWANLDTDRAPVATNFTLDIDPTGIFRLAVV
jgi:hypothetical protein